MRRWSYRGIEIWQRDDGWHFLIGDIECTAPNERRCRRRIDELLAALERRRAAVNDDVVRHERDGRFLEIDP